MKGVSDATYRGLMGLIKGHNDIDMTVTAKREKQREREAIQIEAGSGKDQADTYL